jgi:hypothetical protein
MFATAAQIMGLVSSWPVHSQQGARRNALVASTALAERRRELCEVEEFLSRHAAGRAGDGASLEVDRPA